MAKPTATKGVVDDGIQLDDTLRDLVIRASRVKLSESKLAIQLHGVQLRLWADDSGLAIRPWYQVILELYPRGKVVNQYLGKPPGVQPSSTSLFTALCKHILEPPNGEERLRPTDISIVKGTFSPKAEESFRKAVATLGGNNIKFEVLTVADGVREYISKFSDRLVEMEKGTRSDGSERAGMLSMISSEQAGELVHSAVAMHGSQPWKNIMDTVALKMWVPNTQGHSKGRNKGDLMYVSVLGKDEDSVKGFAIMPTLAGLRAKYRRHNKTVLDSLEEEVNADGNTNGNEEKKKIDLKELLDKLVCAYCGSRVIPIEMETCKVVPGGKEASNTNGFGNKEMNGNGNPGSTANGSSSNGTYINRCGGCRKVMYCDSECQKKDWKLRHRSECKAASEDAEYTFKRPEWGWQTRELALLFVDPTSIPFDDLDSFEKFDWPTIPPTDDEVPLIPYAFVTVISDNLGIPPRVERPDEREANILKTVAQALTQCTAKPPDETDGLTTYALMNAAIQ